MFNFLFKRKKKKKEKKKAQKAAQKRRSDEIPEPERDVPLRPGKLIFNPFGNFAEAVKTSVKEANIRDQIETEQDERELLSQIAVVAFIGTSGTGKSTRALTVASEHKIEYLIDDGLLIHGSYIVAGTSAKTAPTQLESVRQALFMNPTRASNMRRALMEENPPILMILGTSDRMLTKICDNLWLNQPSMLIKIEDITTEEERQIATSTRRSEGTHTIPVPSMEIKHEFSGNFFEPLQRLRRRWDRSVDKTNFDTGGEKTVVRPTFSTIGSYSISDEALAMMIELILFQVEGISDLIEFRVYKERYGAILNLGVSLYYGYNAQEILSKAQSSLNRDIEHYTAINILSINIKAMRVVHKK
ncbi:MAG TPA: hypothetical protein VFD28_03900 [Candidatus Eisenbacteria bacterium]|nr:hypothetical protein [Candidatus Eisenbacteria bacterium]